MVFNFTVHYSDKRGWHSANHQPLLNMHLCVTSPLYGTCICIITHYNKGIKYYYLYFAIIQNIDYTFSLCG